MKGVENGKVLFDLLWSRCVVICGGVRVGGKRKGRGRGRKREEGEEGGHERGEGTQE